MKLDADWEAMLGKVLDDSKRGARYHFTPTPQATIVLVLDRGRITLRTPSRVLEKDEQGLFDEVSKRLSKLTRRKSTRRLLYVEGEGELYEYSF